MKILVTTGNWHSSLVIMESLARQGHAVYLLDHDPLCAGFHSRYCTQGIICPEESANASYVDAIVKIVQSIRFDLLIPTSDCSTEYLSAARERITPHVPMLLPSKELIELARYKDRTYRFALAKGIAIPPTHFPQSLNDVIDLTRQDIFPCVVKKSRGTANKGNTYVYTAQNLIGHFNGLKAGDDWPVIQKYIEGDFYGFLGMAHNGEVLDCLMYKSGQEYATGGTTPYCYSVTDPLFWDAAKKIIRHLNWTGAINMDFIQDREGEFRLLEINPRLSGSLAFACSLGVDLPAIYLDLSQGKIAPALISIGYDPGRCFRFVLPAEIIYALKHKGNSWKLLGNFFNFKFRTDIPWHDPALLFWKLKHVWWYWRDKRNALEYTHA